MKHLLKHGARGQRGMTLIELMVALALGLVVAGVALSSFMKVSQLARTQRGQAAIGDGAQAVSTYLVNQVRTAGYVDLMAREGQWTLVTGQDQISTGVASGDGSMLSQAYRATYPGLYALHGCDGTYATASSLLTYGCTAGAANNLTASLSLAYQVVATPSGWVAPSLGSAVNTRTGFMTDCGGRSPRKADTATASPEGDVVVNRYYLDTANRRLMCIGNGKPAEPVQVATDVEQFQVLYGLQQATAANGAESVAQFVPASTVNATPGGWGSVIAMQICLLMSGETGSVAKGSTTTNVYNLDCAGDPVSTADGRLRRAQRVTLSVRNNLRGATQLP